MGLISVAILCKAVPVADYTLKGTFLTLNVLPFSSIVIVFLLILAYNLLLNYFKSALGLSTTDVVLVFCMTMVANHIPGQGFLSFYTAEITGAWRFATMENAWSETVHPYIPDGFTPRDPPASDFKSPRPIEWFYTGVPPGEKIPWAAWAGPYGVWALMILMLYGMMFAICGLLRKQWMDKERLPFPVAQVPEEMMSGINGSASSGGHHRTSFLRDPVTWWGIGIIFVLHLYNGMQTYFPTWPAIELRNTRFDGMYLTEAPWRHLRPLRFIIYPSVVALTFLISKEISFSLWFFYLILKLLVLLAVIGFGLGQNHWFFMHNPSGMNGIFINQGNGALIAMVLAGVWLARGSLRYTFRQALGLESGGGDPGDEGISPRALWLLLAGCFAGSVFWLIWFNVEWQWALLAVVIMLIMTTGVTRLVCEGGIFYSQLTSSPMDLAMLAAPPAVMGNASFVPLAMWCRVSMFDWGRLVPMVPALTVMKVAYTTGVRRRPLYAGFAVAVLLAMVLGFFGFYHTLHHQKGAAATGGWTFQHFPRQEFKRIASKTQAVHAWDKKQAEAASTGKTIEEKEIPDVARRDRTAIFWVIFGMLVMFGFIFVRSRIFWWPHPIGYVVWSGQRAISLMWLSFFLGWLIKWAVLRYGGLRIYERWKRFFVGAIVGEAIAAIMWIAIAWITEHRGGYSLHFN